MKVPRELEMKILTQAGLAKPARPKNRPTFSLLESSSGNWSITLALRCTVASEANKRDHWAVKKRRGDAQREELALALKLARLADHKVPLPVVVTWTRIGKQMLDDDNLSGSFKALRDKLAEWLGVDDGDTAAVSWKEEQRQGEPGVEVTIQNRE